MYLDDSINDDELGTSLTTGDGVRRRRNDDESVPLVAAANASVAAAAASEEDERSTTGAGAGAARHAVILTKQFRSLGTYPLVTLELRNPLPPNFTHSSCRVIIPANLLAWTIQNTRNTLQQILAYNITLSGNWIELCSSLRSHPTLHTVSLSYLKIGPSSGRDEQQQQQHEEREQREEEEEEQQPSVPDLMNSLSTCDKLRSLKLCIHHHQHHHQHPDRDESNTTQAVAARQTAAADSLVVVPTHNTTTATTPTTRMIVRNLCSLPNLTTLSLALGESTLPPSSSTSFWLDLCQTLHSNTTLTNLGLPAFYDPHQEEEILQGVGILLRVNSTLHTLSLAYGNPNTLLPIVDALQTQNRSLQHLQLYDHARNYYYREALSQETALVSALVEALHYNFVLESIDLSNHHYQQQHQRYQPPPPRNRGGGAGGEGTTTDRRRPVDGVASDRRRPGGGVASDGIQHQREEATTAPTTSTNHINKKGKYSNNSCCSWNSLIEFRLQMNALYRRQLVLLGQQQQQRKKKRHDSPPRPHEPVGGQQQEVVDHKEEDEQKARNIFYQQILHFQSNLSIVFYLVSQHPNYFSSNGII